MGVSLALRHRMLYLGKIVNSLDYLQKITDPIPLKTHDHMFINSFGQGYGQNYFSF